jgi:hypothetical protein
VRLRVDIELKELAILEFISKMFWIFEFLGFLGGGKHELSSTNPSFFIKTQIKK